MFTYILRRKRKALCLPIVFASVFSQPCLALWTRDNTFLVKLDDNGPASGNPRRNLENFQTIPDVYGPISPLFTAKMMIMITIMMTVHRIGLTIPACYNAQQRLNTFIFGESSVLCHSFQVPMIFAAPPLQ